VSVKSDVYKALTATGIPGRQDAYAVGKAPSPPFFIYTVESRGEFVADNDNYASTPRVHVDLFEKVSTDKYESAILDACGAFGPVEQTSAWSQSEQCHIEQFDFTYHKARE
jgi:hypothetical protein